MTHNLAMMPTTLMISRALSVITSSFLILLVYQSALGQDTNKYLTITASKEEFKVRVYARNESVAPITVCLRPELQNMEASKKLPLTTVLAPRSTTELCILRPITRTNTWNYAYEYDAKFGDYRSKHDDRHVYQLPFESGKSRTVLQGYNGSFSHQGEMANALDFDFEVGERVFAIRDGLVVDTESTFDIGGTDPKMKNMSNYIMIQHDDGTLSRYYHLEKDGVRVRIGEKVAVGKFLGFSGNTGYSSEPHLHVDVYRPINAAKAETIRTKFKTETSEAEFLNQNKQYTRP